MIVKFVYLKEVGECLIVFDMKRLLILFEKIFDIDIKLRELFKVYKFYFNLEKL